jgi:uncharacterized LabA/DUF88 family protein
MEKTKEVVYAFIDASNLFYGGEKSLGWKIDYEELLGYLSDKYQVSKAFYFGGVETHGFQYDYLTLDTVPIDQLEVYLTNLVKMKTNEIGETELALINNHIKTVRFYSKLQRFGYRLYLKPVKTYIQDDGTTKRKANCDVEMTFCLMKKKNNFDRIIILSGDGDFLPVLKHLREEGKEVIILARGSRTAKEIRKFAGSNFRDFEYLKNILIMKEK